ncbi:MAG: binding-protein-dependent transport system inner rane component [Myxococcaceae bacterium]|nr:binding-protein-dependent transport system inner rane component [Myxococcaceae bacterium]
MNPSRRAEAVLLPLLVAAALLLAWHWAVIHTHTRIFPSPEKVARGVRELARRGVLFPYIGASLFRVGSGFLLATLLGVPLGSVMGRYRGAATALNPLVQVLRPISPLAWIPLAIVFFGVTNLSTIFLIFLASFFPIVVSTMNAVRAIPVIYLRAAQNFGFSGLALWARVILPAILPQLLTGLRLALGVAWLVVVAAEMIAVDSGLGYLILDARNAGKRYDLVVAGMLLIGVIGLALDVAMRRVERLRWLRWGFSGR